jgi:hypothetical protein
MWSIDHHQLHVIEFDSCHYQHFHWCYEANLESVSVLNTQEKREWPTSLNDQQKTELLGPKTSEWKKARTKKNSHFKWSIPIRGFFFYFDFLLGHPFLGILPAVTSMPEENELLKRKTPCFLHAFSLKSNYIRKLLVRYFLLAKYFLPGVNS